MPAKARPVARGCGAARTRGAVYLELGVGPGGKPIEDYLLDPPHPVDVDALGVSPLGVTLIERDGVAHVLDWVGESHYPNVADYVEEVRRFGLSRKVAPNLPFHRLTPASRILQIHPRAYISNAQEYRPRLEEPLASRYSCPKKIEHHHTGEASFCLGVCWEDVEGGRDHPGGGERRVLREMPSFAYEALRRPEGIEPGYRPAIFASFPISRIVVIRGDADEHEPALKAAKKSVLPVDLEDA